MKREHILLKESTFYTCPLCRHLGPRVSYFAAASSPPAERGGYSMKREHIL
jgi:hypothetical protein